MRIVLINPPFLFPTRYDATLSHCLGLRSISATLKANGFAQVEFIDALMAGFEQVRPYANGFIVGLELDEIVARIPADAELVGVSAPFSQLAPVVHDLIEKIKGRLPRCRAIMGGVYPSTQPKLALRSRADAIVVGEGEEAFLRLARGEDLGAIAGVWPCGGAPREKYTPAPVLKDLDRLPFPDTAIPQFERYLSLSPRLKRGCRTASILTSRGCPFTCEFCSIHPVYGHLWRPRSAAGVMEEIERLVHDHDVRFFEIEDDNFTMRRQRTIDVLEGIIRLNEGGAGLAWRTPNGVRLDTLDDEMIRLIKRANCQEIVLGLEHGDPEMLRIMEKRLDLERAFEVVGKLVRHGIPLITMFIIVGYPGETRARFENSLAYLRRLRALGGNVRSCVNIAQPYPGTRLFQRCLAEGILPEGMAREDYFLTTRRLMNTEHIVSLVTPDFDAREVMRRKQALQTLFARNQAVARVKGWAKQCLPAGVVEAVRGIKRRLG